MIDSTGRPAPSWDALQAQHPDWTLWRSDEGHCYATRRRVWTTPMTLDADTPDGLALRLAEQAVTA